MPSPLLQLRIPQDLADWLEAKYPSRGEVAAYVRELLTAEQMKEAVAPLLPIPPRFLSKPVSGLQAPLRRAQDCSLSSGMSLGYGLQLWRKLEVPLDEAEDFKAEPKPKARRKKSVKDSPTAISVEDGGDRDAARKGQIPSESPSLPARSSTAQALAIVPVPCDCGGKIYQVGSRKGQCSNCSKPRPKVPRPKVLESKEHQE